MHNKKKFKLMITLKNPSGTKRKSQKGRYKAVYSMNNDRRFQEIRQVILEFTLETLCHILIDC